MKMIINTFFMVLFMFNFSFGQVDKKVDENFKVNINVKDFEDFYGSNLYIDYDTTYVEPILNISNSPEFTNGTFLGSSSSTLVGFVQNSKQINIGSSLLGELPGMNGSGLLCTLHFKTKKEGLTIIQVSGVVKDSNNNDQDVKFENDMLNIKPLSIIFINIE